MYNKFCNAIKHFRRGQKGITGLETAIILIAFVTVASVLAYSVLSAGIFSSERGKAAVYAGLSGAQSTMSLKGSVVGVASAPAADPELGSIYSLGGLIMLQYLVLQAGSNPMLELWADDTITVNLDAGVTGTATSGTCTVVGSPVALHPGVNVFSTQATVTDNTFNITLVAPPGGPVATALTGVTFHLALAIYGDSVDMNNVIINYWDSRLGVTNITLENDTDNNADSGPVNQGYRKGTGATPIFLAFSKGGTGGKYYKPAPPAPGKWSYIMSDGSTGSILSGTLEAIITVAIPSGASVESYDTFTIQINPPTGASITIQRTLPPMAAVMTLN